MIAFARRPSFCLANDMWELGIREPPTILLNSLPSLPFAPVSQSSYRNRYVAVASFSDSLPWHHFRCHCRGTISVSPPWHPFPSALATNASYHAHVNFFIKLHKS